MDPGKNIPAATREALAHDIYMSTPTLFVAVISLLVINVLYVYFMDTPFAWALLGWNIAISAARVGLTHAIFARPGPKRRILTDAYLFMLLLWCLTQGVLAGFAEASNIATLQVLAANSALALQGPLCARNYPLPRLCKLLLLGLTIPWVSAAPSRATIGCSPWRSTRPPTSPPRSRRSTSSSTPRRTRRPPSWPATTRPATTRSPAPSTASAWPTRCRPA
jgi:hypothetical protein